MQDNFDSEKIRALREQRRISKETKIHNNPNIREAIKDSRKDLNIIEDVHDVKDWTWDDWKELLNLDLRDFAKIAKELATKEKLKLAKEKYNEAIKNDKVSRKLFSLTGSLPGEKSGVVKNEEHANETIEKHLHKVKISAAGILAYSKDAELKEKVMKDLNERHPEMVEEVRNLAKKARERTNEDEFKKNTAGMSFAKDNER